MQKISITSNFFHNLLSKDEDLAAKTKEAGCLNCAGVLNVSNFPRKPRGIPDDFTSFFLIRLSLCCRRCRKRVTPPSVRFWGRRIYTAITILLYLLSLLIEENRDTITIKTAKRWTNYFQTIFTKGDFWRARQGDFMPSLNLNHIIPSLAEKFEQRDAVERWRAILCYLAPAFVP